MAFQIKCFRKHFMNSLSDLDGVFCAADFIKKYNKLITAESGDGVPGPYCIKKPICCRQKQLISDHVSKTVIDFLEVIQVYKKYRKTQFCLLFFVVVQVLDTITKQYPIGKAG